MATMTIKNLPDDLYVALEASAARHRRSINREAIVALERGLGDVTAESASFLERARGLRERTTAKLYVRERDLAGAKSRGRL